MKISEKKSEKSWRQLNIMNREILFRGKRVDNGEWEEGYLFDDG